MASKQFMALEGFVPLQDLLKNLPPNVARAGYRESLSAAATPIVRLAKVKAPKESKTLKRAIGKKVKTYKRSGVVIALIGARSSITGTHLGKRRVPFRYLHLVEKGTKPHAQPQGQHPGAKANPFLEESYQATKGQAIAIATSRMAKVVRREAQALSRSGKK